MLINKTLQFNDLRNRTTMNAKISVFVICVETIIYFYCITCMIAPVSLYFYQFMVKEKTNQETILSVGPTLLAASFPFQITL